MYYTQRLIRNFITGPPNRRANDNFSLFMTRSYRAVYVFLKALSSPCTSSRNASAPFLPYICIYIYIYLCVFSPFVNGLYCRCRYVCRDRSRHACEKYPRPFPHPTFFPELARFCGPARSYLLFQVFPTFFVSWKSDDLGPRFVRTAAFIISIDYECRFLYTCYTKGSFFDKKLYNILMLLKIV